MTLWDLRRAIEDALPWWSLPALIIGVALVWSYLDFIGFWAKRRFK